MNVQIAAERTIYAIAKETPARDPDGMSVYHARWMLRGIIDGYIQHEKAHRWLGYAQGILVREGSASLADMKQANRDSASSGRGHG